MENNEPMEASSVESEVAESIACRLSCIRIHAEARRVKYESPTNWKIGIRVKVCSALADAPTKFTHFWTTAGGRRSDDT